MSSFQNKTDKLLIVSMVLLALFGVAYAFYTLFSNPDFQLVVFVILSSIICTALTLLLYIIIRECVYRTVTRLQIEGYMQGTKFYRQQELFAADLASQRARLAAKLSGAHEFKANEDLDKGTLETPAGVPEQTKLGNTDLDNWDEFDDADY